MAKILDQKVKDSWALYNGDCVETVKNFHNNSIHFSIYSPPFTGLYIYNDSIADMGNSVDDGEFFRHFSYLIPELYRITVPGRLCAVHCKNLVNYKGRDGKAGLRDFRGEIIRHFTQQEWTYHSEVVIWTDPVLEMQRTKAHGLLYKQFRKDSSFSRQGLAEYIVIFRKWAIEPEEILGIEPIIHTKDNFPLEIWQRYASPVWFDIRRTDVLNTILAREDKDERHICPLQLSVIQRCLELWTNPNDVVLDPFVGIGSVGYQAVQMGRRFIGIELKEAYYKQAIRFLEEAEKLVKKPTFFGVAKPK